MMYRKILKATFGLIVLFALVGFASKNDRMQHGEVRLRERFEKAKLTYPPQKVWLTYFKDDRLLRVWIHENDRWQVLTSYPAFAASGNLGPKLREGDLQVPEGEYRVVSLNPQSRFHLSLRLNYPNAWDRQMGRKDGRKQLGGDIMIHGGAASVGCIAIGNYAIEEVFALARATRYQDWEVILAPTDLRKTKQKAEGWVADLYKKIEKRLRELPVS